jgi:hypothetical protein
MEVAITLLVIVGLGWYLFHLFATSDTAPPSNRVTIKYYKDRDEAVSDDHTLCGEGEFDQEIVGEASYQPAIHVVATSLPPGHNIVQATIELEDNNPHDNNAVVIKIGGQTVGYLARATARAYRKLVKQRNLPSVATVPAMIRGGGGDYYGIWLGIPEID